MAVISQFKWDATVTILRKLSGSLCANPFFPVPYDAVDRDADAGRAEVLIIDGPGVVITGSWVNGDIFARERSLDFVGNHQGVVDNFLVGVAPDVVRAVVTRPEDRVDVMVLSDVLQHVLQSN